MDDLLAEFLTESTEMIGTLSADLVKLEQTPDDPSLLANIFRLMHTVKGTCGFLGLARMEKVAHAAENLLGRIRDGEIAASPEAITMSLEASDRIREILTAIEATGGEPAGDDGNLIERLNQFAGEGADTPAAALADEPDVAAVSEPVAPAPVTAAPAPAPAPVPAKADVKTEAAKGEGGTEPGATTIRVSVGLLENLMTMVSELVLTRNQLMQILRSQRDSEFGAPLQRLSQVTTELQESVMKTRMQPIGNAWGKLPRLVRDLGHELGKKIDLKMIGAETELDRQVLEMIKDPLTHMVRNSADHGLEGPAERVAAGKRESGTITLNAFHEGGHIVIEIADDGRGLPVDKIRGKAIANGIATEAELANMPEQQVLQFIFKAGFSTAQQVTSVSGRGVGMDVVKTNIEKIGGTIELKSELGKGTRFVIKIPLTLAIVSALIVECAGERFAIPQIGIVELVRVSKTSETRIERLNDSPVLRLRERLLPLVGLREVLKLGQDAEASTETFIVVMQVGTYTFGIIVDRVFDTEEIVVKPVAPVLRDIAMFSGNTILGDGTVVMILDPNGIAAASGAMLGEESRSREDTARRSVEDGERTSLLLFRAGSGDPKAVPLALVSRLEDIEAGLIERADGRPVVQYRERLMPLVGFDGGEPRGDGRQSVLVFADDNRWMGLMVDEIVDIVEARLSVQLAANRPGLVGSAIVSGKATDVIDVGHYVTMAFDDWFKPRSAASDNRAHKRRILLVDDSAFFRNMLKPLLEAAGYEITAAASSRDALEKLEAGGRFDLVLSDIEMPDMDGIAFAEALRRSERWAEVPVVALSSHAAPADLARSQVAGIARHVAKSDRAGLLEALTAAFESKEAA